MQGKSANIWKENILEDLKGELLEYKIAGEFLADIKKKFEKKDEKNSQGDGIEKVGARKKNNRGICSGI